MEPLALLCNLYGDGPKTLRRLQRVGFESLAALLAVEAGELAERTGWPESDAARLLDHARALASRTDSVLLEPEPETDGEPRPPAQPPAEETASTAGEEDARGKLLETWRELDGQAPPPALEDVLVPSPPPARNVQLDALGDALVSEPLRARLRALGIRDLEELIAAPTLELARELGLGFTRLQRLQHLARRKLAAGPAPERSLPRPPRVPPDPGVGGPFA